MRPLGEGPGRAEGRANRTAFRRSSKKFCGPGEALGPCVEGYCLGELVCIRDRCVDPTQADGQGTDAPPDDTTGTSESEPPPDDTTGGGAESGDEDMSTDEPWCTRAAETHCICGLTEDYDSPDTPCSPDVIPDPSLCCATPGWPSLDSACHCSTLRCWSSGSSCGCFPDQGGDQNGDLVEACQPPPGRTCCLDGAFCRCSDPAACSDQAVSVDSCDVTQLSCSAPFESIDACNEGTEA